MDQTVTESLELATFIFDRASLQQLADEHTAEYAAATPFPHIVIDDFLPAPLIEAVSREFPGPTEGKWQEFSRDTEVKLALADVTQMGPITRNLLAEFNGQVFTEFVERLTSINGLVPDPHYDGGGLHQIRSGGFLKIHADFNRHDQLNLDRRLNALLYLNQDWDETYGGHLELWDRQMNSAVRRVLPIANRLVIFSTTDFAFHGHPKPLTCPPDRSRRSLALYYYSNGRPAEEVSSAHTTLFQSRPGERLGRTRKERLIRWTPPAVYDWIRSKRT